MIEYIGPIPPEPEAPFDAAKWTVWQNYQTAMVNIRMANEREARFLVTDKQHADRLLADTKCAEATQAGAVATAALAAAQQAYANVLAERTEPEVAEVAAGLQALAAAVSGFTIPAPVPSPAPLPDPIQPPITGLLADAFAVVRRLVAAYKVPPASP